MTLLIHPDTRLVRSRDILESEIDGDVIALDIERGECYGLNSVGSAVWRHLAEETSVNEITAALVAEFDVGEDECRAEVTRLVEELAAEGLVKAA